MLLVNNKDDILRKAFHSGAEYLFHDTEYTKYDLADKTLSCGRRPDSFKLWLTLQRYGHAGFTHMANHAIEKARYLTAEIKNRPEAFTMVNEPMGSNVCFSYTPPAFRGNVEYTDTQKANVHKLIFDKMMQKSSLLIQHQPLTEHNIPNFWRVTCKGEKTTVEDMDFYLDEIDRLGNDIDATMA